MASPLRVEWPRSNPLPLCLAKRRQVSYTWKLGAGATDSAGRWAYVPVASTTLPEEDAEDQLGAVVREMLERGRNILNAFGKEDLRPLVDSSFGDDTDSVLQSRSENEYPVFGEAMARAGDHNEDETHLLEGAAPSNSRGRSDDEIRAYDEIVARFVGVIEPAVREQVARTLFKKATVLSRRGHLEDEIQVYDEIIGRFGDDTAPALREQVTAALISKGRALRRQGRSEDESRAYDEVVARLGDAIEPALRKQVARALMSKAVALKRARPLRGRDPGL